MGRSGLKLLLICCINWGGSSSFPVKSAPSRDLTAAEARGGSCQVGASELPAWAVQREPLTQDDDSEDQPLPDDTHIPMAVDSEQEGDAEETVGQHGVSLDQGTRRDRDLAKASVQFHAPGLTFSFAPLRI